MKKAIIFSLLPAVAFVLLTSSVLTKNVGKAQPIVVSEPVAATELLADEVGGEVSFQDFLKKFPKKSLPFESNSAALLNQLKKAANREEDEENFGGRKNALNSEFAKWLPRHNERILMSRMPQYIEPVMAFSNEKYHAVVYAVTRGFSRMYRSEYIATFDKNGGYRGTYDFVQIEPEEIRAVSLDANLMAKVKIYKVNWKDDPSDKGYQENSITGLSFQSEGSEDFTRLRDDDQPSLKQKNRKKVVKPIEPSAERVK